MLQFFWNEPYTVYCPDVETTMVDEICDHIAGVFNAVGTDMACLIGRIEALEEIAVPLVSPSLESGTHKLVCPVSLNPDEYLEVDWTGTARHFDPNGALLGNITPQGSLRIARGENRVRFSCACSDSASPRAEVNISLRG